MRLLLAFVVAFFGIQFPLLAQSSCPAGTTTSISGVVYAPNGTDPLPNVSVYIPTSTVGAFTPGVSCPVIGEILPGAPQLGTTTAADGSFTIANVPTGADIPLVIASGRWRRQITVPSPAACANTVVDASLTRFPRNQSEGDIPKIAIATGRSDQVECVLLKVGIDKAEFTNIGGTGRINLFEGDGSGGTGQASSGGAVVNTSTPAESTLMANSGTLNAYDVLMLPCEGANYTRSATQLANLVNFANLGGRVYASHFAYSWMYMNPPFSTAANWAGNGAAVANTGTATVDTSFAEGATLSQWLQIVGASTTPGQIAVAVIKKDISSINSPTQSWLTLNATGNPVMQFVFDTPIGTGVNQCGRVLFNEYHVEDPPSAPTGVTFPLECSSAAMTPQEKLLEFSLFELTNGGGNGTLTPPSQDFGSQPVNSTSAPKSFSWTNNGSFQASVSSVTASGDFSVVSNNCTTVAAGASCQINVVFTPTALGSRTGTLTLSAGAQTLTSALSGTGLTDLTVSPTSLNFGSIDVGASITRSVIVTNAASVGVAMPALTSTGDFSATTTCPSTIPANGTCSILITFKPTTSGARTGSVAPTDATNPAYSQMTISLTGNGLDFTLVLSPTSGTTVAGINISSVATLTSLAGFAANVSLTCTTATAGSGCAVSTASLVPAAATTSTMTMTTTSAYTVVGFGSVGGKGALLLIAIGSGWLLWSRRRSTSGLLQSSVLLLLLGAAGLSLTGCSGKQPAQNSVFTAPGTYMYTLSATDGTITHTATYSLTVTAK